MTVTIEDAWKHVSNKITNKVNNIWDDLDPMIIPVDIDGTFMTPISCMDKPEYNGDSYDMIRALCWDTDKLPSGTFLYVCPARVLPVDHNMDINVDNIENEYKKLEELPHMYILAIALVHPMYYDESTEKWEPRIEHGMWLIEKNEFQPVKEHEGQGQLPIALGALSFKWALDHGTMGELGNELQEALNLARQSVEKAKEAFGKANVNERW